MVGSADEGGIADHVAGGDALQPIAQADLLLYERVARHDNRRHPKVKYGQNIWLPCYSISGIVNPKLSGYPAI